MDGQQVGFLLEAGAGKVLTGLTKRIVKTMSAEAINDPATLAAALAK